MPVDREDLPSREDVFRWLYRIVAQTAVEHLAAANAAVEDGVWPAGQSWAGLGGSSRAVFMHSAREQLGIEHGPFLALLRSGMVEIEDIWENPHAR